MFARVVPHYSEGMNTASAASRPVSTTAERAATIEKLLTKRLQTIAVGSSLYYISGGGRQFVVSVPSGATDENGSRLPDVEIATLPSIREVAWFIAARPVRWATR